VDSGLVEAHESERKIPVRVRFMYSALVSKVVGRFVRDERGATMLEYGLLVGLIAIVAVAAMTLLGGNLTSLFENASTKIPS